MWISLQLWDYKNEMRTVSENVEEESEEIKKIKKVTIVANIKD